jgi:hypothetical protein
MPTLGNALDFAKYEGRNLRAHVLGTAPASPVTGQLYYNSADNTLYWWDSAAWVSARGGAAATPPATTGALGTIQLAGDLAGTATSPQIAAGVITDAEVAAANKDGASGTPSMRRTGSGAGQVLPGDRSLNYINDNFTTMNGNFGLAGFKLVGVGDPTVGTDGANKQYVDAVAQGLDAKQSVRAASTSNITTTAPAGTIDGVTLVAGDRILLKQNIAAAENGIWIWNSSATPLTRATDADTWNELVSAFVFVEEGTTQAESGWVCTVDRGGTLGTTAVNWTQFSGAGQITSGAGLTKTGNTLDVGAGAGITVNADSVQVANNGITNAMIADGAIDLATADVTGALPVAKGGTGSVAPAAARTTLSAATHYSSATHAASATPFSIGSGTHNCGSNPLVQVADVASGAVELPDITVSAAGLVTVTYGASVGANTKRITIVGL